MVEVGESGGDAEVAGGRRRAGGGCGRGGEWTRWWLKAVKEGRRRSFMDVNGRSHGSATGANGRSWKVIREGGGRHTDGGARDWQRRELVGRERRGHGGGDERGERAAAGVGRDPAQRAEVGSRRVRRPSNEGIAARMRFGPRERRRGSARTLRTGRAPGEGREGEGELREVRSARQRRGEGAGARGGLLGSRMATRTGRPHACRGLKRLVGHSRPPWA